MKYILLPSVIAAALALRAHAYLPVEDGAFDVRHIHMVERGLSGEIIGRAFAASYSIDMVDRDENDNELVARKRSRNKSHGGGRCQTISACGTPGGCAMMAPQTYCKGESASKGFQRGVKQTGANGVTSLKLIGESIGRGPMGVIANTAKAAVKGSMQAKKENDKVRAKAAKNKPKKSGGKKNGGGKKKKRSLEEDDEILNRRDFDVVERDEDMNLIQRSEYSLFDLVTREEDGSLVYRECEMYNGNISCM